MNVRLNYGKEGYQLGLPESWEVTVINKKPMPLLDDPAAAVAQALANPVAARPLAEEAAGAQTACILICDVTRPVPNHLFLRPMIEQLMAAGVPREGITVLVATGLHRPNLGEELANLVGDPWVLENVTVANHNAREKDDHVSLGLSRRGTPIMIDERFAKARVKIATGLVEPHFMAGYSGGRKVIVPGVCFHETIRRIHTASFFEDSRCANCRLLGNPLHDEQLEIVSKLGRVLSFNTVIDEERRLGFASFGDIIQAHAEAVAFMRQYAEVKAPNRFKTVVTTSAGFPLDSTYYQTVKGMVGAMDILAPGGRMYIASACTEGMGSPEYVEAQKRLVSLGPDGFLMDILPKMSAAIDEWQTEMQLKPMRIGDIYLYTKALSPEDLALTGVNHTDDLAGSLAQWVEQCGDNRVAVVPEGPYVIPRYAR